MFPSSLVPQSCRPRYPRLTRAVRLAAATALLLMLTVAETALAASGNQAFENGGQNVGNALLAWARALLLSTGAIMGIGALVKRSVGEGVTILILIVILGAFIYDQPDTENLIRSVWGAV
jgi:hypothetical protein